MVTGPFALVPPALPGQPLPLRDMLTGKPQTTIRTVTWSAKSGIKPFLDRLILSSVHYLLYRYTMITTLTELDDATAFERFALATGFPLLPIPATVAQACLICAIQPVV